MNVQELLTILNEMAPFELAEDYDNSGLVAGVKNASVNSVLVCLDATLDILKYAVQNNINTVLTHHPLVFKAIKNFDKSKQNTFKTFANMCIERQLITAIKTSNRQKHMPLNSYLSLNTSAYDNDDENSVELMDTFNNDSVEDPLETIMKKEYYEQVQKSMDESLSKFEKQVLDRFIKGESYNIIAQKLNSPIKSVDNAIQRIRKKAIKNLFKE